MIREATDINTKPEIPAKMFLNKWHNSSTTNSDAYLVLRGSKELSTIKPMLDWVQLKTGDLHAFGVVSHNNGEKPRFQLNGFSPSKPIWMNGLEYVVLILRNQTRL